MDYYLKQGEHIQVNFKAKSTLVIVGGSQDLQFLNDPVHLSLAKPLTACLPDVFPQAAAMCFARPQVRG